MSAQSVIISLLKRLPQRVGGSLSISWTGYKKPEAMRPRDTFVLDRKVFTDVSTVGELYIGSDLLCYTLEDTCRASGVKVPGKTAIPAGKYEIVINYSNRFLQYMPLLLNVPNFEGVRIHTGNTEAQTQGCILVGMRKAPNQIFDSRKAFDLLFPEIQKRLNEGKLYLAIYGGTKYEKEIT
jgi:hypothetical protein